jgi:serine/threonine-protein kinase RsbW
MRGEAAVAVALASTDDEIAHAIYAGVSGGLPPHDDVAILAVSFDRPLTAIDGPRRASRWRFEVTDSDAAQRARGACIARLRGAGLSDADVFSAELVFGELLGNVVRYALGPVEVILDVSGEAAVLHVADDGRGFEFRPRLPADLLSERGRGLFLVTAFAEELTVERRRGGGSHARAVLRGQTYYRGAASLSRDAVL